MKKFNFILVLLLTICYLPLTGTDVLLPSYDTLKLVKGSKIIIGNSKIKMDRDTTILIHEGLNYRIQYPRGEAGNIFFDSLETKANRKRWTQQLHNIVITSPQRPDYTDTIQTHVSSDPFISQGGKFIRNIRYSKLEPFGPTIFDTTRQASSSIENFGNEMHRITQDRVIENHLLFREGDLVDPNEFADNERILRELPFIQDVRIDIIETSPGSDSVDIRIITKDNFSIGAGGAPQDYDAGRLSIFEKNLFGLGQELHIVFHWDAQRSPWMGTEIIYIINNLGGSFINSKLRYAQVFDSESYQFELNRRFFTPDIKWAGALNLERTRAMRLIDYIDTVDQLLTVKYNIYDLWAGRSFYLSSQRKLTQQRLNLVVASRLFRNHYIDRPEEVDETMFYDFHNRNMWLTSFSVSSQSFFKSNLILDFGRTEDVPQGMLLSVTAGPEFNEFNRRFYTGVSLSQGRYIGHLGYFHTLLEAGGFVKDNSYIHQGVINAEANYFTPLFIINRFKFRHFFSARYVRGIRRFDDEFIGINDFEGIRGFRSNIPMGQQKVIFNYEADAFTPYYLYGFRFVIFGFADVGMVGPEYQKWHDGKFYSGLGVGVRIKNERLVFETISIRLGYYPNHPEKSFPLFLDVYGEKRLNADNFYVTKPEIIKYE
ncbi:MAG: hypothetical protein KAT15_18950 [Bacteroidales bacterium]|nr:hypothetical protein [Bacteroidales bacterium]